MGTNRDTGRQISILPGMRDVGVADFSRLRKVSEGLHSHLSVNSFESVNTP